MCMALRSSLPPHPTLASDTPTTKVVKANTFNVNLISLLRIDTSNFSCAHHSPEPQHGQCNVGREAHDVPAPPNIIENQFDAIEQHDYHSDPHAQMLHFEIKIAQVRHEHCNENNEEIHRRYAKSLLSHPEADRHGH